MWDNYNMFHSAVDYPLKYGPRTMHQANIGASRGPLKADVIPRAAESFHGAGRHETVYSRSSRLQTPEVIVILDKLSRHGPSILKLVDSHVSYL